MIIIKTEKIVRESAKAVLVRLESSGQLILDGSEENKVVELWLPKSQINRDYKRLETIHCPQWVYDSAVDFAMRRGAQ